MLCIVLPKVKMHLSASLPSQKNALYCILQLLRCGARISFHFGLFSFFFTWQYCKKHNSFLSTASMEGAMVFTMTSNMSSSPSPLNVSGWDSQFTEGRKHCLCAQFNSLEVTKTLHFWQDQHTFSLLAENVLSIKKEN